MTIKSTINSILKFINTKRLTKLEEGRVLKNLSAIYDRLRKRDYKIYGYSNNKFDIPDRLRETYTELDFHCQIGKVWAKILNNLEINNFHQIVDICPGYSPKIELGLFYVNYGGEVIVIDKDSAAISGMKKFINLFNPKFVIKSKRINIFGKVKNSYQMVLANHILDDLVLYYFADKNRIDLQSIYDKEENFKQLWNIILENKENNLNEVEIAISEVLTKLIKHQGILCITHYKSYTDRILDMDNATIFLRSLFKKIIIRLEKKGFVKDQKSLDRAFKNDNGHFKKKDCMILKKSINI